MGKLEEMQREMVLEELQMDKTVRGELHMEEQ